MKNAIQKLFKIGMLPLVALVLMLVLVIFYFFYSSPYKSLMDNNIVVLHYADNISRAHKKIIDQFNTTYAGLIRVETIDLPFYKFSTNDRKELLARSLRSKNERIDIFGVDLIWVDRFSKWAEDLSKRIPEKQLKLFWEPALHSCYDEDSVLVAVPHSTDVTLLIGNGRMIDRYFSDEEKEMLERGVYWDEFISMGKKVLKKDKDKPFFVLPYEEFEGMVCNYFGVMLNLNNDVFKDEVKLPKKESEQAFNIYHDLIYKYKLSPKSLLKLPSQECSVYFLKSEGVFFRGWPAHYRDIQRIYGDEYLDDYKIYPLPRFRGTEPVSVFGGWNLMLSKYSQHKDEALIFLKYLISKKAQEMLYEESFILPARKDIYYDSAFVKAHNRIKKFERIFEYGIHRPYSTDYTRISDIISFFLHKSLINEITFEEAREMANTMIDEQKILIK